MKNYLPFLLSILILSCSTQKEPEPKPTKTDSSITIDLNTIYDSPARGFLIFYPISEMEDSLRSKIVFPDLTGIADTSFASIFFTGKNHAAIENSVLVLVGNHASPMPIIYVDYTNDLDFNEAREPYRFSDNFIDVSILDVNDPKLIYTLRLHKPEPAKKPGMREMLEQYITKGEKFTDFFMDERRNIRVGDFVYKKDSLRIGMIDWNVNGKYNDVGEDRIVFGKYGGDISGTEESDGAVVLDSITYFQINSTVFELTKLSDDGTMIIIKPTVNENMKDRLKVGSLIPDLTFKLISGEETSIKSHLSKKKYLYLNFWATWCAGCKQEVDDLKKLYSDFSDKVTIVSLNYNENAEKTKSFVDEYEINWINGISTSEINEKLLIHGLPRNILIDSEGKIVEMNIHPSKLVERMEEL